MKSAQSHDMWEHIIHKLKKLTYYLNTLKHLFLMSKGDFTLTKQYCKIIVLTNNMLTF